MFLRFLLLWGIICKLYMPIPIPLDVISPLNPFMTNTDRFFAFGSPYLYHFEDTDGLTYFTTYPVDLNNRYKRSTEEKGTPCPTRLYRKFEVPTGVIDMDLVLHDSLLPSSTFYIDGELTGYGQLVGNSSAVCRYRTVQGGKITASLHLRSDNLQFLNGFFVQDDEMFRISPAPWRLETRSIKHHDQPGHVISRVRRANDDVDPLYTEDEQLLQKLRQKLEVKRLTGSCGVDISQECPNGNCRYDLTSSSAQKKKLIELTEGPTGSYATIELAVFLDFDAYKSVAGYLNSDDAIHDSLLTFINQVDILFHLPTFGHSLDIRLVRLDILKYPVSGLITDGNIEQTLNSFTEYAKGLNPQDDADPKHWDHALLLTGKKQYTATGDMNVMGLSRVGGMCNPQYSASVVEFGTTNNAQPIQSSGFLSSYLAAHEIGHSLGLFHDGEDGNTCDKNRNIMASARSFFGQTAWSSCDLQYIQANIRTRTCLFDEDVVPVRMDSDLDFKKPSKLPGQIYTASDQCGLFKKDPSFVFDRKQSLSAVCDSLQCRGPQSSSWTNIGPALDGTYCGDRKWCFGGSCIDWPSNQPIIAPGWTTFTTDTCQSACIVDGAGYQTAKRSCTNPSPQNTEDYCQGDDHQTTLCSDSALCKTRKTTTEYANKKCTRYYNVDVPGIKPEGKQQPYDPEKSPERSCAIYCKANDSDLYRHPKEAVAAILGEEAYFPDGTPCNADGSYYCIDHLCVPRR